MTVLWKTRLVRLLAAALLLVVVPGASKVVCVSPTGHDTIEDWASLCCVRSSATPESSFSQPAPCQGCTDYPVAPTTGIQSAQRDSSRTAGLEDSALVVTASVALDAALSATYVLDSKRQFNPINSPLPTTSLRC